MSPSLYVERIHGASGHGWTGPIAPEELLIHAHRDRHPVELAVQFLASRLVELTGNEWVARHSIEGLRSLASRLVAAVGLATGSRRAEALLRNVLGPVGFEPQPRFRFRQPGLGEEQAKAHVERLRREAQAALAALGSSPRLRVLLTGATGFIGSEILAQAAREPHFEEVVCLLRPERLRDPKTNRLIRTLRARERGARLLRRLDIDGFATRKFHFVDGDIEKRHLGLAEVEIRRLGRTLTHVVHCAASVSFDESYESLFRANVLGSRNALELSLRLQAAAGSPFVAHVAVETSYVHGRAAQALVREGSLVFPPHYYNNFYELTKAMATLEADRAMLESGLRVTQLLPSIVIGDSRTGNNNGDTKVVNAPVNAFGRLKQALDGLHSSGWRDRLRASLIGAVASAFPADRSAALNLVPVDRVVSGVLAALTSAEAVGTRIHLASDRRIRSGEITKILREELGITVRRTDPTLTRTLTLPLMRGLLEALGERRLGRTLERLGAVLGVYSEWGQPIHSVGNDVGILGLPTRRPDSFQAFRMVCRHNRYVLWLGSLRDPDEIARRERLWEQAIDDIEFHTGRSAATLPHAQFLRLMQQRLDLDTFEPRASA